MNNKISNKISLNIILLGLVSFITDISSEMIFPVLPLFLTALGGTGLIIGLVGGLSDSISSILKVFSGYLSDKSGKRLPFVFGGYGLSSASKIFLSFSTLWQHAVLLVSLERAGKGLRDAPRDAIIVDSSEGQRGKAFGIHRAMDTAGAVIGSGIAFVLIYFLGLSLTTIIFSAGVVGFFALIPLLFVKEKKNIPVKTSLKLSLKALNKDFRNFLIIAAIFAFGNFTCMFFIIKSQTAFSDPNLAIAMPILLYVWFNAVYAVFSIPAGLVSDKIGRKKVLIAGYFCFSLTCIGFIFSDSLYMFIMFFALYGLAYALIDGTQHAFISDLIPENLRGTGLGTFHTVIGLVALPAGISAGILWQYNPGATFAFGAVMGIIAVFLLFWIKPVKAQLSGK